MAPLKGKPQKIIIVKPLEVPNIPVPAPVPVPEKVPANTYTQSVDPLRK